MAGLVLAVLGISAAAFFPRFSLWLRSDWTHLVSVVSVAIIACTLLALYEAEKELDSNQFVQPEVSNVEVQFRPLLHFTEGDRHNILIVNFEVVFSNPTDTLTRAIFPTLELLHRRKKAWRNLVADLDRESLNTIITYRSVYESQREFWYPFMSADIRPRDEMTAQFGVMWMVPDESLELLDGELALRFTGKIMGHPRPIVLLQPLPRVDKMEFA